MREGPWCDCRQWRTLDGCRSVFRERCDARAGLLDGTDGSSCRRSPASCTGSSRVVRSSSMRRFSRTIRGLGFSARNSERVSRPRCSLPRSPARPRKTATSLLTSLRVGGRQRSFTQTRHWRTICGVLSRAASSMFPFQVGRCGADAGRSGESEWGVETGFLCHHGRASGR